MERLGIHTIVLVATLLILSGCADGQRVGPESGGASEPARAVPDQALVEDLRKGGYVMYFCHAATEPEALEGPETLGHRGAQRNLSEEGRAQAVAMGEAFRELRIPVGEVLSSPYFRTRDTAVLAFGRAEPTGELLGPRSDGGVRHRQREADLTRLLSTRPPAGTNTVLVGHASNAEEYAGIPLEEGEAAVVEPLGDREFSFVARVSPEDWEDLSGAAEANRPGRKTAPPG